MTVKARTDFFVATFISAVAVAIFYFIHPAIKIFFIPAMVIAYICYFLTRADQFFNVNKILPVYLTCVAIQLIHFAEEVNFSFHKSLPELRLGIPPIETNLFIGFNMVAYSLFVLAGIGIYKNVKFMMVIVWFFVIAGVVGNAIGHAAYAIIIGGYFPGLYTSFAYWIFGPVLLFRLLKK